MLITATEKPVMDIVERRSSERHVAVMLIAKFSCQNAQTVCRIRNISATGARIETNLDVQFGQSMTLELRSDLRMTGKIMWVKNGNAGIQFDTPIDVTRYLLRSESKIDRIKARAPRYDCFANIMIVTDSGCYSCTMPDIGLSGAGISDIPARAKLRPGHVVKIIADGISSHHASVAWVDGNKAGIKFRHPLKYTDLQEWLIDFANPQISYLSLDTGLSTKLPTH
ncbi:PilZ domain-containing protein [Sphingorhabdus sp. IMCC26285]|uniref:PilZ domain-containing protein n=1 Tax=Sphingorhabdus profundilacus TaxID=2509718 RepID=A0A6I4M0E6_9SPHN|nr:PilZ domain-containing protein [Sphingorhabdus profundilacus]MVZ98649.1 PilZ domain-containing protein [Sphingorhabdus profundilacus]